MSHPSSRFPVSEHWQYLFFYCQGIQAGLEECRDPVVTHRGASRPIRMIYTATPEFQMRKTDDENQQQ